MYGTVKGLHYGQNERVDELNERIQSRQFSDKPLAPNFSRRPATTRYSIFPIADRIAPAEEPIRPVAYHTVDGNFNPASRAPPATFLQSIDVESGLRNQTVAKQRAPQSIYVPSSNSDLYKVRIPSRVGPMPHPTLFSHSQISSTSRENMIRNTAIGKDLFNNNTRTQLRQGF